MLINTQIENFLADIKSNNISFTTTAAPKASTDNPIASNLDKRSVDLISSIDYKSPSRMQHTRSRRDFWDLFSSYSLSSSVNTANENYKITNENF